MTIKIKHNVGKDNLTATVELPRRRKIREEVQTFTNSDMIEYLKEQGVNLEDWESKASPISELTSYSTKNIQPMLKGEWVFSKKVQKNEIKVEPQTSKKSRTKKTTNS